jgi:Recombinase
MLVRCRRRGVALGGPKLAEARERAVASNKALAVAYAANVLPVDATSLHQIAEALNARGITTPRGGKWDPKSVSNVLARAMIAGRAEKCGLPLEHLRDFYQQLWFAYPAPKMYAEELLKRDFAGRGGFVMTGGLKDVRLMLSTAQKPGQSSNLVRSPSATSQTLGRTGLERDPRARPQESWARLRRPAKKSHYYRVKETKHVTTAVYSDPKV